MWANDERTFQMREMKRVGFTLIVVVLGLFVTPGCVAPNYTGVGTPYTGVGYDGYLRIMDNRPGANAGNAQNQYSLGIEEYNGWGKWVGGSDCATAAFWFQKSASQGYAPALRALGQCYLYGYGVAQDRNRAIELLKSAADKGDAFAKAQLSRLQH